MSRLYFHRSLLVLVLAALACSLPYTSTSPGALASAVAATLTAVPSATPVPATPTPSYQPVFEPADCAFARPPGTQPQCGYLVVPENRAVAGGRTIKLHVAIFRSSAEGPSPDPVLHLAGGPGSSSLDVAAYLFGQGLDAILERRDFILFDQRGTGHSLPRLACPERDALEGELLSGRLSDEQAIQAQLQAFAQCRARLVAQGIDPTAYTSVASAADVNDLRRALGYDKLDLYGDSYGTRLALTVMRDHPEALRSVVLDSTYPLEVNLYTSLAPNAERAFEALFAACAADPGCNGAYPDLKTVFYNLVDQLNASPVHIALTVAGTDYDIQLDGGRLIDVLFDGLYNPIVAGSMPRMIYQVRDGEYALLGQRLMLYFDTSGSGGMTASVQCGEEVPFNSGADAFSAAQGVQPQIAAFFPQSVQYLFEVCKQWSPAAPDPRENQPVTSDIPTLVLAGELDPITPPEWGRQTAGHLSHAYFYEFAGSGHWVTRSSGCARRVMLAFLEDPSVAPELECLQSQGRLVFMP